MAPTGVGRTPASLPLTGGAASFRDSGPLGALRPESSAPVGMTMEAPAEKGLPEVSWQAGRPPPPLGAPLCPGPASLASAWPPAPLLAQTPGLISLPFINMHWSRKMGRGALF